MPPLLFVDSRGNLPREAVATINLSAQHNATWLIKPADRKSDASLDATVHMVDPRDIDGAHDVIRDFRATYQHLSTNPPEYERSCFERFILLDRWASQSGARALWHFDTDAWATRDLQVLTPPAFSADMIAGLPQGLSGRLPSVTVSQAYLTSGTLSKFARFLLDDFFSKRRQELETWFASRRAMSRLGGVSDMMAWGAFLKQNPDIRVSNSFATTISGYLMIDTLYQLPEQLHAQGIAESTRGILMAVSREGLSLQVGATTIAVAGVHLAGADKPLVFAFEKGRTVSYMGMHQRYVRASHRLHRRSKRLIGRLRNGHHVSHRRSPA